MIERRCINKYKVYVAPLVVLELDEPYFVGEGLKLVANAIVVPRRCSDELQSVVSEEKNADFFCDRWTYGTLTRSSPAHQTVKSDINAPDV
jgi:hypothetical protein